MPLHDWTDDSARSMMHHFWIAEIVRWIKPGLPKGYRAFIGTSRELSIELPGRPDIGVHNGAATNGPAENAGRSVGIDMAEAQYGKASVAQVVLGPNRYIYIEHEARLVAAIEIISPANKDRPSKRTASTIRYAAYLHNGIHLMLIDLLPKPYGFSFADSIATEIPIPDQPACPSPMALSYYVGERSAGGESLFEMWRRPLRPGQTLPMLPLWLTSQTSVSVDLESTYMKAAADAYLS